MRPEAALIAAVSSGNPCPGVAQEYLVSAETVADTFAEGMRSVEAGMAARIDQVVAAKAAEVVVAVVLGTVLTEIEAKVLDSSDNFLVVLHLDSFETGVHWPRLVDPSEDQTLAVFYWPTLLLVVAARTC